MEGRKLEPGVRTDLAKGGEVCFGGAEAWRLVEGGPPVASAIRAETEELRVAEQGILVLPDTEAPVVSLFMDEEGMWLLEAGEATRRAVDQESVEAGGRWVLNVPPPTPGGRLPTTQKMTGFVRALGALKLRFRVSQDDEYVELEVIEGNQVISLGARAHHYLLLTLARARLADAAKGDIAPAEQGWLYMDDLLEMLKTDPQHINLSIFRARQQLAQANVLNAGAIVERRVPTKQLRLGTAQVELVAP